MKLDYVRSYIIEMAKLLSYFFNWEFPLLIASTIELCSLTNFNELTSLLIINLLAGLHLLVK